MTGSSHPMQPATKQTLFKNPKWKWLLIYFYVPYFSKAIQVKTTLTGNLPDFIHSHSKMHRSATIMSMPY